MDAVGVDLFQKAERFLAAAYEELDILSNLPGRLKEVKESIDQQGTYFHTTEELNHGARMAWRNSNRCIGRLYWKTLKVIDAREVNTADDIFSALEHHIHYAFNNGDIRSTITVFRQKMPGEDDGLRILNHQLLRFACHQQADESVLGDPAEKNFTAWCKSMGYDFKGLAYELLPLAIKWPGVTAELKKAEYPSGIIIPLLHPEYQWFEDLGLCWYAVPIISDMMLEIGGIEYTAAPFNGWYMGTEIGSRNLADTDRYNLLPIVAEKCGLDMQDDDTLWKDRALVELNRAVLFSFRKQGVTISNHHESAEQFLHFEETEKKKNRSIKADWSWITPPMSSSATGVFHREYDNTVLTPNFFYQDSPIAPPGKKIPAGCPFHKNSLMPPN